MRIILTIFCTVIFTFFTTYQESPELITKFLKVKWEVQVNTKGTLPSVSGNYLLTVDNFIIDANNGNKIESIDKVNSFNSLLIHSTVNQLKVTDVNRQLLILERRRNRSYYIGPKEAQLVNDSIWVEVTDNTLIQCLNLRTNQVLWTTQSDSRIFNRPLTIGKEIYVPNLNQLLVLDKYNGNLINFLPLNGPVLSGMKVQNNTLYMIVENDGIIAFDLITKKIKWKIKLNRYSSRANQILIDGDRIYYSDSGLHAVSQLDGSAFWNSTEKDGVFIKDSALVVVKNYIIFYTYKYNENLLTVADKNTGKILYQGLNSNVLGGDSNNSDGVAKEDLLLIDFVDVLINDKILIGVLDNKIYGLEVLKY